MRKPCPHLVSRQGREDEEEVGGQRRGAVGRTGVGRPRASTAPTRKASGRSNGSQKNATG